MKLNSITIKNFKAIEDTTIALSDFTVIVGTNGSGKSSVLQALHWMLQSARNSNVAPSEPGKGSTLSEIDATYMPSPEYKNASHSGEYGNFAAAPKMDLVLTATIGEDEPITAPMWIKSARNEGISVHVPSNSALTAQIRAASREVSAYIPGLAGIPLAEEKRSKLIVYRQAAAGDANTVLRNILDLASRKEGEFERTCLDEVEKLVSSVLGPLKIRVSFEEESHYKINADFQTESMRIADPKRFKPLELAGIGFLQVIQIFSYLVYFKPRILLVDEPDSHLHPDIQEKLVSVLQDAALKYDTQVILTTHSPSVVRSLDADATLIWMKDGAVQEKTEQIRKSMGWGLLDKSVLLVTEDKKAGLLNAILGQWPDLDRKVAVWAARGSSRLPQPDVLKALNQVFGEQMQIVVHRDSDFMLPDDQELQAKPYADSGMPIWFTEGADIESCWVREDVIASHFGVCLDEALEILAEACQAMDAAASRTKFNTKRNELVQFIDPYKNGQSSPKGQQEAFDEFQSTSMNSVFLGKELVSKIRKVASDRGLPSSNSFGKSIPEGVVVAPSLRGLLEKVI